MPATFLSLMQCYSSREFRETFRVHFNLKNLWGKPIWNKSQITNCIFSVDRAVQAIDAILLIILLIIVLIFVYVLYLRNDGLTIVDKLNIN